MSTESGTTDSEKKAKAVREAEEKRKAAALKKKERSVRNLQQCLLGQNLEEAASFFNNNPDLFNYRTFRQIKGKSSSSVINSLRGTPDMSCFFNVRQSILSLMQPRLRVYKVSYEKIVVDVESGGRKSTARREPVMREIKFSDTFGSKVASSTEEYLKYETTKPNWRNVGLESFSYKYIGKEQGPIENNITAQMTLSFKSLKDLQAQWPGEPPPPPLGSGMRYVDLILFPPAKINRDTKTYNPKHHEVKVEVGYSMPSSESLRKLGATPKEIACLKTIKNTNVLIALGLHRHSFDIEQDGSVRLDIEFFGRIESSINSTHASVFQSAIKTTKDGGVKLEPRADIKRSLPLLGRIKSMIKAAHRDINSKNDTASGRKLVSILSKDEIFIDILRKATNNTMPPTGKEADVQQDILAFLRSGDNVAGLTDFISDMNTSLRNDVYKTFMTQLIDGNPKPDGNGTRLFCASVPKSSMERALGLVDLSKTAKTSSARERKRIEKRTDAAIGGAVTSVSLGRCDKVLEELNSLKGLQATSVKKDIESESGSKDDKRKKEEVDPAKKSIITGKFKGDSYQFYYVYLGDIVELASKNAGLRSLHKKGKHIFSPKSYIQAESSAGHMMTNLRMLLGPLEYYDKNGKLKMINFAQFPIAFDVFREWFVRNIISKDATGLSLGSFLKMLINDLVLPAMGADCVRPIKPLGIQMQSIELSIPGKVKKGLATSSGKEKTLPIEESLPSEGVIDVESSGFKSGVLRKLQSKSHSDSAIKTSYDYLLIQTSTSSDTKQLAGVASKDIPRGIYHFNIGSDKGLLSNMRFSKVDLEGVTEMRSRQALNGGGDQLDQLTFPYNVDLELIGNTLFIPGMVFYANPSFLGLGDPHDANSLAYKLNLGGYYLALEVETTISPGEFITRLPNAFTLGHGKVRRGL